MYLNADVPYFSALIRNEFLYNFEKGHGEFTIGYVFGVTSLEGRCLLFSVLLETGAQWARMPIHAIVFDKAAPKYDLRLIQPWDCPSYYLNVIAYTYLRQAPVKILLADGNTKRGNYMFTVDYAQSAFGENDEHKCTHLIKTEDGLLLGQPNNRCLFGDAILTKPDKRPDYKSPDESGTWSAESDFIYLENPRQVLNPSRDNDAQKG